MVLRGYTFNKSQTKVSDIVSDFLRKINRCGHILDEKSSLNMCKEKDDRKTRKREKIEKYCEKNVETMECAQKLDGNFFKCAKNEIGKAKILTYGMD